MKNLKKMVFTTGILFIFLGFTNTVFSQNKKGEEIIKIKTSAVCGMCKDRLEKNIAFEKGVKDVVLDLKTKILTVTYKPSKTNADALRTAVTKLGYDADDKIADQKAHDKLPACCKKGNETH